MYREDRPMRFNSRINRVVVATCLCAALVCASFVVSTGGAHAASKMKVTSSGIKSGQILPQYCYTDSKGNANTKSLPLKITDAPKGTKCYAVYMYDKTYPWVHWLAVNYGGKTFKADASKKDAKKMAQGKNDFGKVGYGGPTPPDKTHTYVVKVYALKSKVSLKDGFTYKEFEKAIKGKVLATASVNGKCAP
jgi:Raf kinase inhibitor-like YbhB/YbcL family protein